MSFTFYDPTTKAMLIKLYVKQVKSVKSVHYNEKVIIFKKLSNLIEDHKIENSVTIKIRIFLLDSVRSGF